MFSFDLVLANVSFTHFERKVGSERNGGRSDVGKFQLR